MGNYKNNKYYKEGLEFIDRLNNKFSFELYCGNCDLFNTDDCPHINKVTENTEWKLIKCTKFEN